MRRLKHIEAIVGTSSYVSMSLIYLTGLDQEVFALTMPSHSSSLALVLAALCLTLLSHYSRAEAVVPLLKVFTAAITTIWLISYTILRSAALVQEWGIPLNFLQNVMLACLLFLWNYHYASLKEKEVQFEVSSSVALTLFILPIYAIFMTSIPWIFVAVLPLLSAIALVAMKFEISKGGRIPLRIFLTNEGIGSYRNRFFASRIIWGLFQGLMWGSMSYFLLYSTNETYNVGVVISSVISLAALIAVIFIVSYYNQKGMPAMFVSAIPFAMSLCLGGPFLQNNIYILAKLAMAITWLSWVIQSFIQLKAYSQFLKIDALRLSFYEKGLTFLATLPGHLLAWIASQIDPDLVRFLGSPLVVMASSYSLVFISTLAIARHVMQRTQKTMGHSFIEMTMQHNVRMISDQYGLTTRETQVFELMAQGYSRPYIEQALHISKSTAKTHLYHIYQKLPVENQDGILQLVSRIQNS